MKSEPTEKPRGKKTAASETADRKNGRSPSPGHDEWWERLMMEPLFYGLPFFHFRIRRALSCTCQVQAQPQDHGKYFFLPYSSLLFCNMSVYFFDNLIITYLYASLNIHIFSVLYPNAIFRAIIDSDVAFWYIRSIS